VFSAVFAGKSGQLLRNLPGRTPQRWQKAIPIH
jgi:hypothetical protein